MTDMTEQVRLPPPAQRKKKKPQLSINTAPVDAAAQGTAALNVSSSRPYVSNTGSLRGQDISVTMSGLRMAGEPSAAAAGAGGAANADGRGERMALKEFDVVKALGEGSSGVVQLVYHKPSQRNFAMKVITLGCAEEEWRRILFEARTLHASAVHGIIAFEDAFYAENRVHMVMEYMNCGSLDGVLKRRGKLPERIMQSIAAEVCGGLCHLHTELKVVHRDIKPGNILLNSAGQAKLADFGMSGQLASTFSRLASWVGTAAYMSPERISGADYSYAADVWSLGVSLFECMVGHYPFGEQGPPAAPTEDSGRASTGSRNSAAEQIPEMQTVGVCFWELLHEIVDCDPPTLPAELATPACRELVLSCMNKLGGERPTAAQLLQHEWLADVQTEPAEIVAWLKPK